MKAMLWSLAAMVAAGTATSAAADTVLNTDLKTVNGTLGPVTATTTTDATGTRTKVTGPDGGGFRYSDPAAPKDVWQQQNVGASGTVGITTDYARSGNGSLFFEGVAGSYKADAEIYFSQALALSDLSAMSFDLYRDASSNAAAHLTPSLRLIIGDGSGNPMNTYLIFEPVYNGYPVAAPIAEGQWYTFGITGSSTVWANNGNLIEPPGSPACPSCYRSLSSWQTANAGATIIGLSAGIGSGWGPVGNNSFRGALDNISLTVDGQTTSYNFEVAVVPEPGTWALLIAGFGSAGAMLRRRRSALA